MLERAVDDPFLCTRCSRIETLVDWPAVIRLNLIFGVIFGIGCARTTRDAIQGEVFSRLDWSDPPASTAYLAPGGHPWSAMVVLSLILIFGWTIVNASWKSRLGVDGWLVALAVAAFPGILMCAFY